MVDDIKKIIEISVRAPSGDNLQPWKFVVSGNTIKLFIRETVDEKSVYNFKNRGNYVAHGALIESIIIVASHFGYDTEVSQMPDSDNLEHTANIKFIKTDSEEDSLFKYIDTREVNRGAYHSIALSNEERYQLQHAVEVFHENGEVKFIQDEIKIKHLAKTLSTNEKLIFQNKALHDGLYKFFRWTQEEAERTKDGLNVERLGFNKLDVSMIRLLESWPVTKIFGILGVPSIIAAKSAHVTRTSSAICAIVANGDTEKDFINGGRIFQRLWLTVAKMNLALQPAFGPVLLGQRAKANEVSMFSKAQANLLRETLEKIRKAFNVGGGTLTMVFRVGKGDKVKVPSLRKEPEITIEN